MSTRSVNSIEKRFCAHARAKGNSCSLAVHVAMIVVFDIGGGGLIVVGSGPKNASQKEHNYNTYSLECLLILFTC